MCDSIEMVKGAVNRLEMYKVKIINLLVNDASKSFAAIKIEIY